MLKYCEAYRTMRESLCRDESRGDFCRTQADTGQGVGSRLSLNIDNDDFSSKTQAKNCYVSKDIVFKRSTEVGEGFERQFRRQSVNFEEEFTFMPRLNLTSLKLAKERSGRAHEAVERRANALAAEVEMNFTFKPKVSSKSEKIAQGLKTSFFERQLIHVERQRKKLDNQESLQLIHHTQGRLSPVIRPGRHRQLIKSEMSKSERSEGIPNLKLETELEIPNPTRSAPDCLIDTTKQEINEKKDHVSGTTDNEVQKLQGDSRRKTRQEEVKDFAQNSPYSWSVENMTVKRSRQASTVHKRLKTYPGVNKNKVILGDVSTKDEGISSEGHKRATTIPGPCAKGQYNSIPIFNRLRQSKETAENAIKDNKVFVCHGPYPVVRASLRKRGWVEKHFKGCPAVVANKKSSTSGSQEKQNSSDNEDEENFRLKSDCDDETNVQDGCSDSYGDDTIWNAGNEGKDCEYTLLSRLCRNATASFFWTCKRDDIDFKYLRKDQIANHFSKAYSFTTKVGLCTNLRNLLWFEDIHSDTFFPRCHRLGSDEEKKDFIDDYRVTSACNILKLVLTHAQNGPSTTAPTIVKSKSTTSVRTELRSRLNQTPLSNGGTSQKSRRSKSSLAAREDSSVIGQVPSHAVTLAIRACEEFISRSKNEDIDESYEETFLTDENWQDLIDYYHQIIHNGRTMEGAHELSEKCQEMLEEMRKYLPQLDLDGVRNVWIVKPGAKSRGRGIMCMDRLQDILKLVSSTVKKENRWIIQKYIECPLLVYNTKFDIRQWFLVTDWNPLTLWFYKDCYFRFCSQEFTLDNFEPCIHLANNSIQKHYQNGVRDERLPENNMWSSDDFREYLRERKKGHLWEEVIYPGMRQAIVHTLECCQITLEARKNSFELYGADFMLSEDYKPWLIEINSSPAMSASTMVTRKLCANVIEDTMKVVLDRREDKSCDTGRFELAFKQPYVDAPPYIGINLAVHGKGILCTFASFRRQSSGNRILKLSQPKGSKTTEDSEENTISSDGEPLPKDEQCNTSKRVGTKNEATVLKLMQKSLTLNCEQKKSDRNIFPTKAARQTRSLGNGVNAPVEFPRRWKSVEVLETEKKSDGTKKTRLQTLNVNPSIKPVHQKKKLEKKLKPANYRFKLIKKQKMAGGGHVDDKSKHQLRIVTIPDVGVPRTILRYTDKRFRQTKTVPVDMGSETKLRKDPETVK